MPKRLLSVATTLALVGVIVFTGAPAAAAPAAAAAAMPCQTWTPGEATLYWLNVGQGDSQLIVGPTGRTLLVDLGENAWNSTVNSNANRLAARIQAICGTGSSPVALNYIMASHHHLDHIGYARNVDDGPTSTLGNGVFRLLNPGGLNFTVETLIDRDGGTWVDTYADGKCHVGTSANPADNIRWNHAGTTSQTARRWICWLYGPPDQPGRANITSILTLTNEAPWPSLDLGPGVTANIVNANGKGTVQADGVTPVSGDHTLQGGSGPPSENDYSIAVLTRFGKWRYATAGDSDGEYNTSGFGYTYNNIETDLVPLFGPIDTLRANHHGSGHSSSPAFVGALRPVTAFISCGNNSYGHPSNRMLDTLRTVPNDAGVGADIYLANNPCDLVQSDRTTPTDYTGTFNAGGDVVLRTTGGGSGYTVTYDDGLSTNVYLAYGPAGPVAPVRAKAVPPTTSAPVPATAPSRSAQPSAPAVQRPLTTPLWETDGR